MVIFVHPYFVIPVQVGDRGRGDFLEKWEEVEAQMQ